MRLRPIVILSAVCLLIHLLCLIPVGAYQHYDTKSVSGQEHTDLMREIRDFTLADCPERDRMIKCFAISEEGQIALAFDGEYAQIDVYWSDGTYLYGYTFENRNNAFSVFFEGEDLSVYHVKGEFVVSFDANGNCLRIHRALNTRATSDAYHNDFYRASSGQIGGISYTAEKTISFAKYARFTVKDALGNKTVIYEVSKGSNAEMILSVITFTGIVIGAWFCVKKYKRLSLAQECPDTNT